MNCLAKNNAQKTPFLRLSKAIVLRTCAYKTVFAQIINIFVRIKKRLHKLSAYQMKFAQKKGLYVQKVAVYV